MLVRASWRHYQHHPWQLLLLLLGIMLGVAVVAAVQITTDSARHSFRLAQAQLHGRATHRILADQPLPEALYTRLKRDPADWRLTPRIEALLRDDLGQRMLLQLLAIDPLSEAGFRDRFNERFETGLRFAALQQRPLAVVLARSTAAELGLVPGDPLPVQTPQGKVQLELLSLLDDDGDPRLQRLLLMDIGQAQQLLAMPGQLSAIDLILDPVEVAALQALLPPGARLEATAAARERQARLADALFFNLNALSLLALVVGLFLVFNSVWFSLQQRRPLYAQLRTIGLDGAVLYRYLLCEVALIALLATLLGVLGGVALAQLLLKLVLRTVADLYSATPLQDFLVSPLALGKVLLLGVGGSLLSAWQPCRETARVAPRSLQQRFQLETKVSRFAARALPAAVVLLLLAALLLAWPGGGLWPAFGAVAALLLACTLLMPGMVRGLARLLLWGLARRGVAGPVWTMIPRDLSRNLSRTGIAAMALMIAVAATVGMSGMVGSFRQAVQLWLEERLNADLYVSREHPVPGSRLPLPAPFIENLRQHPQVAALATLRRLQLEVGARPVELYVSEMPEQMRGAYRFRSGRAAEIWVQAQAGGILLSEPLANRLRLQRGDWLTLETARGRHPFTVAGVYYDFGSDSGRLLLHSAQFERYWRPQAPYAIALYLHPGREAAELERWLRRHWSGQLGLQVLPARAILSRSVAVFERTFLITDVLRLLAVVVAFMGILGSLLALQLERNHELSLLKALGFSRHELLTLQLGQALLLGLAAGLVAVPVGELLAWVLTEVVQLRAFGWSIPYAPDWRSWPAAVLLALLAALLASLWPAWRALRLHGARRWE